ncbi:MAG TPA: hypothetical protein GXX23_06330 [Firmicutes bacterium]|nr:hypothetical protein [Candidatus Fermentithermobacillaceae bacterium]
MPSEGLGPDTENVMAALRELLAASQLAYNHAAARDFVLLAAAIDQRTMAIKTLKDFGDLESLPAEAREPARDILTAVVKIDEEIAKVLRREMAADQRAILDITARSKAFSAYDRALPKPQNFDRQK